MEFFRKGQRRLSEWSARTKALYDLVDTWLDGDVSSIQDASSSCPFESKDDVDAIAEARSSQQAFADLRLYFEAGFDLRFKQGDWWVRSLFLYGRLFTPEDPSLAPFRPPRIPPTGIVRGRGEAVVRAFGLESLPRLRGTEAFVFSFGDECRFVLLSERPQPWLDLHIDRTREALDQVLSVSEVE